MFYFRLFQALLIILSMNLFKYNMHDINMCHMIRLMHDIKQIIENFQYSNNNLTQKFKYFLEMNYIIRIISISNVAEICCSDNEK